MNRQIKHLSQNKKSYAFDKKIDMLFRDYFKLMFIPNSTIQIVDKILTQIDELQLQNLIYRVAFCSADEDLNLNEQQLIDLQYRIDNCKLEIKKLQEHELIAKQQIQNKKKYNRLGRQIKRFDKNSQFDLKMTKLAQQLKQTEQRFNQDIKKYEQRKQLLRVSYSALRTFCKLSYNSGQAQSQQVSQQILESGHNEKQIFRQSKSKQIKNH